MSNFRYSAGAAVLTLCAACGTVDRRIDPDAPDPVGGAVLRSQDLRAMADRMALDLSEKGVLRSADPEHRVTLMITSLRNDSSDPIDKQIVLEQIQTRLHELLGRQVRIVDRSTDTLELVQAEIAAKRRRAVTTNPSMRGHVAGVDFALGGTIKDRPIQGEDMRSVYYLVTFKLVELETTEIVWTKGYEAKFVSQRSVIAR